MKYSDPRRTFNLIPKKVILALVLMELTLMEDKQ